jgi:hypothetical protein
MRKAPCIWWVRCGNDALAHHSEFTGFRFLLQSTRRLLHQHGWRKLMLAGQKTAFLML